MAAEQLQIQVSANVSNAIKGLGDLEKGLKSTETAGTSLGNKGLPQVTKGANQANTAMINLGRTVSDAPFGFIGIANNIGPLVENFTQLRKESGSTGGALKQLGASLAGPGGLIVGIQLAVAAVQFIELGLSRWGVSSKKAKEEQDKLAQGTNNLIETITKQRVEFESLVKVARNVNQSEAERNQALTRLNEILPDTIGKLTQQNIATEQGAAIIQNYIRAVEARATAELLVSRIAENNVKLFDNRNKTLQETQRIESELLTLRTQLSRININATGRAGESAAVRYLGIQDKINSLVNEQNDIQKEGRKTAQELINLNNQLRGAYESQLPLVNDLTQKQTNQKEKIDEITQILKKYKEELSGINWDEQNRQIDGVNKRLELAGDTLRNLYLAGVKESSVAWKKVATDLEGFALDKKFADLAKSVDVINQSVKDFTDQNSLAEKEFVKANEKSLKIVQERVAIDVGNAKIKKAIQEAELKRQQELANTINGLLSPAIDNMFNAIAEGGDPFAALRNSVQQLGIEIAKTVVKAMLLKAIQSTLLPGSEIATVGGGATGVLRGESLRTLIGR
jgi:hypothetical protein